MVAGPRPLLAVAFLCVAQGFTPFNVYFSEKTLDSAQCPAKASQVSMMGFVNMPGSSPALTQPVPHPRYARSVQRVRALSSTVSSIKMEISRRLVRTPVSLESQIRERSCQSEVHAKSNAVDPAFECPGTTAGALRIPNVLEGSHSWQAGGQLHTVSLKSRGEQRC